MAIKSIDSSSSFDLTSRQQAQNPKTKASPAEVVPDDAVSLRSQRRPEAREELRTLDEALLLASSLRAGILADRNSALSVRGNQDTSGLAELLSH